MARIFISYKRKDYPTVDSLRKRIERETGEICWMDTTGIESDAQFINVIINAIKQCEIVLFMYSSFHMDINDWDNDWTLKELRFAKDKKKRIVFINIDRAPISDVFNFEFGAKQQVDALNEREVRKLITDIKTWLKIPSYKIRIFSDEKIRQMIEQEKAKLRESKSSDSLLGLILRPIVYLLCKNKVSRFFIQTALCFEAFHLFFGQSQLWGGCIGLFYTLIAIYPLFEEKDSFWKYFLFATPIVIAIGLCIYLN